MTRDERIAKAKEAVRAGSALLLMQGAQPADILLFTEAIMLWTLAKKGEHRENIELDLHNEETARLERLVRD